MKKPHPIGAMVRFIFDGEVFVGTVVDSTYYSGSGEKRGVNRGPRPYWSKKIAPDYAIRVGNGCVRYVSHARVLGRVTVARPSNDPHRKAYRKELRRWKRKKRLA